MQRDAARVLDEGERRRMGTMMVEASTRGGSPGARAALSPSRQGATRRAKGRAGDRRRPRRMDTARRAVPLLLESLGRMSFRKAFCAAVAAWTVALVLSLGCFEVLRW